MKIRSGKAKGRRACVETRDAILKHSPDLEGHVIIPTGSVIGRDLILSPTALLKYPFALECKNTERLDIWAALKQAQSHVKNSSEIPLLTFKRNHSDLYAALSLDAFLTLLAR